MDPDRGSGEWALGDHTAPPDSRGDSHGPDPPVCRGAPGETSEIRASSICRPGQSLRLLCALRPDRPKPPQPNPLRCRTEACNVRPQRRPEASTSPSRVIALGMDEEGRMLTGLEWERG